MKFLFNLFILSVIFPFIGRAQTNTFPFQSLELATYLPTATSIKGLQYTLPYNAHSYYIDNEHKELIILLKLEKEINVGKSGEMLVWDMEKSLIKWRTKINTFNVFITNQYIITSEKGNTHCYRRTDGKQMWMKTNANIQYIDEAKGVALTDYIRGLNIHTGKTLWQRYLPGGHNWEGLQQADDSSVIVATGGLYKLNLYTGKGWSTSQITDKGEFDPHNSIGVIAPLQYFPEVRVPEIGRQPSLTKTTTSGIVTDGNTIYFATNKRLLSLDKETGTLLWEAKLPYEKTGISSLHIGEQSIVYLNEGKVSNTSGVQKRYGVPYLVTYNKERGDQKNAVIFPEGSINDAKLSGERMIVLGEGVIYACDLATTAKPYTFATTGNNYHFMLGDRFRITKEGGNEKISEDNCCYIYNSQQGVIHFEKNFFAITNLTSEQISVATTYKNYELLYNGKNTINKNNKSIIQTPAANKGFIFANKLIVVDSTTISEIPLTEPK